MNYTLTKPQLIYTNRQLKVNVATGHATVCTRKMVLLANILQKYCLSYFIHIKIYTSS